MNRTLVGMLAAFGLVGAAHAQSTAYTGWAMSIPDDTPAGVSGTIHITDSGMVENLAISITWPSTATEGGAVRDGHTWLGDLVATLSYASIDGLVMREATLMRRIGKTDPVFGFGDSANLIGTYLFRDDGADLWAAAAAAATSADAVPAGTYRATDNAFDGTASGSVVPVGLASVFGGLDLAGDWTLTISDHAGGDIGRIEGWALYVIPTPGAAVMFGLGTILGVMRPLRPSAS